MERSEYADIISGNEQIQMNINYELNDPPVWINIDWKYVNHQHPKHLYRKGSMLQYREFTAYELLDMLMKLEITDSLAIIQKNNPNVLEKIIGVSSKVIVKIYEKVAFSDEMADSGKIAYRDFSTLLKHYTFIDGSPCGMPINN